MSTKSKNDRIALRIKHSQKKFLRYAASLNNMKLSAFVLTSAYKAAEEIVSDKVNFYLSEEKWNAFCKALDRPAREVAELKKLFSEGNVFDE